MMRNFGALYRFELKKLFHRRMLWISLAVLTAVSVFLPAALVMGKMTIAGDMAGRESLVYSHYDLIQCQRTDPARLDGRPFDTDLIRETVRQVGVVDKATTVISSGEGGEQSVTVRRVTGDAPIEWSLEGYVKRLEYMNLWNTLEVELGQENVNEDLTLEDYLAAIEARRALNYDTWQLSDGEKAWWAARTEKIDYPLTVSGYADGGWTRTLEDAYVVNIFILLFATIALAGLYPMERQRRTGALAACAKNGGAPLYLAKYLAGLTVSLAGGAVMLAAMGATSLLLLGPEDANAAIQQLINPAYGAPMTVRKLALIACGLYLAASVIHGAFVMGVSLVTKSGTAAMGICFGALLLFAMVPALPSRWRAVSQLWSLLPGVIGGVGYGDARLVHLGVYLTNYQAAPLLWLILTAALAALGLALHRRVPKK